MKPRRILESQADFGIDQQKLKRAETITRLRKERDTLQAKVVSVEARMATFEGERAELQSLRQERKEVLTQVDGILKELDRLDIQ